MSIPNPQPHGVSFPHRDEEHTGLSASLAVGYDGDWTYDDATQRYTNGEIVIGLNKPRTV